MKIKIAEIRKNDTNPCPFGLPIPFGCKCSGNCIKNMSPLNAMGKDVSDYESKMIGEANTKLLAWNLLRSTIEPIKCIYAGNLLNTHDAVECNFNDSAPGQDATDALMTAPFYTKIFNSSIQGLYTFPVGLYSDYNVSRNLWFGSMSFQGSERPDLIKMAVEELAQIYKYTNS
jgi:hypothetical protein